MLMVTNMLSLEQQEEKDKKILLVVNTFLEHNCRITDEDMSNLLNIPRSTIGRYMIGERTKKLIGIDNYAYIKRERMVNKLLGRKKGGSKRKDS